MRFRIVVSMNHITKELRNLQLIILKKIYSLLLLRKAEIISKIVQNVPSHCSYSSLQIELYSVQVINFLIEHMAIGTTPRTVIFDTSSYSYQDKINLKRFLIYLKQTLAELMSLDNNLDDVAYQLLCCYIHRFIIKLI